MYWGITPIHALLTRRWDDRPTQMTVRRHTPGIAHQVYPREGRQCCQLLQEFQRTFLWMNEHSPTFLVADPPAKQGEPRFAVALDIDGNKRLLITARDVQTGRVTHRDYPVIKLT